MDTDYDEKSITKDLFFRELNINGIINDIEALNKAANNLSPAINRSKKFPSSPSLPTLKFSKCEPAYVIRKQTARLDFCTDTLNPPIKSPTSITKKDLFGSLPALKFSEYAPSPVLRKQVGERSVRSHNPCASPVKTKRDLFFSSPRISVHVKKTPQKAGGSYSPIGPAAGKMNLKK